ncbi:MAG: sulfotransferase [Thermomonas sp.]
MTSPFTAPRNLDPRQLWETAQRLILENRVEEGRACLLAILETQPRNASVHMLLAGTSLASGKLQRGTAELRNAAMSIQNDPALLIQVMQAMSRLGETNDTRMCLRHPLIPRLQNGPMLTAIGHVYQGIGLNAEALQMMDRAKRTGYDNADFRYFHALQLQFNGRLDEAEAEMESCLKLGPTFGRASLSLARIRKQTPDSNHVDFLRERLHSVPKGSEDHAAFEFALYKEYEDLGDLDAAWAALQRANAVMAARVPYAAADEEKTFDLLIERFDSAIPPDAAEPPPGPTPIFIVGMPRSGTTLLERVLGSHSQVTSAGELSDMPRQLRWAADRHGHPIVDRELLDAIPGIDFELVGRRYLQQSQWRANGRPFYIDKLPPNFMLIGCIRRALPHARVVHMARDPMDVCFSNYRAMFGDSYSYSYDLDALSHHYRQYERLMRHWREAMPGFVIDVSYTSLVTDTERTCRELLDACGLPFEDGCLDHTRNRASVATLSSAQVRQPIHSRGLREWERYGAQLQGLRSALSA